jgi:hypothetical protein
MAFGVWHSHSIQREEPFLLVGGDKSGISKDRFYTGLIRIADARYGKHLKSIDQDRKKK